MTASLSAVICWVRGMRVGDWGRTEKKMNRLMKVRRQPGTGLECLERICVSKNDTQVEKRNGQDCTTYA